MTDPRRLSEGGDPRMERLLRSARNHRVPEPSKRRLLRRAGWYLALGVWAGRAAALGQALTSTSGLVGVVVVGSALAGAYVTTPSDEVTAVDKAWPRAPSPRASGAAPIDVQDAPAPEGELEPFARTQREGTNGGNDPMAPAAAQRAPGRSPEASARPARQGAAGGADLRREVEALDAARGLIASNQPAAALRALQDYEGRFPRGRLRLEARVLRVEALARSGRTAEAHSLGEAFLLKHPNGFLADRVRRILGGSPPARR